MGCHFDSIKVIELLLDSMQSHSELPIELWSTRAMCWLILARVLVTVDKDGFLDLYRKGLASCIKGSVTLQNFKEISVLVDQKLYNCMVCEYFSCLHPSHEEFLLLGLLKHFLTKDPIVIDSFVLGASSSFQKKILIDYMKQVSFCREKLKIIELLFALESFPTIIVKEDGKREGLEEFLYLLYTKSFDNIEKIIGCWNRSLQIIGKNSMISQIFPVILDEFFQFQQIDDVLIDRIDNVILNLVLENAINSL